MAQFRVQIWTLCLCVLYLLFRGDSSPADDINSGVPAEHNGLTDYGKVSNESNPMSACHKYGVFCVATERVFLYYGKNLNYRCWKRSTKENIWRYELIKYVMISNNEEVRNLCLSREWNTGDYDDLYTQLGWKKDKPTTLKGSNDVALILLFFRLLLSSGILKGDHQVSVAGSTPTFRRNFVMCTVRWQELIQLPKAEKWNTTTKNNMQRNLHKIL
jgi:hypothetical protein